MNWGHKITITFILFTIFVATLVTICVRQDFFLVAPNYYEEELAYQEQIDKKKNYNQLAEKPSISVNVNKVQLSFPNSIQAPVGKILFFRPSHGGLDKEFKIDLNDNNIQTFPKSDFLTGKWTTKLVWESNNQSYYVENTIIL